MIKPSLELFYTPLRVTVEKTVIRRRSLAVRRVTGWWNLGS